MQLIIALEYVMDCSNEGLQNMELKRLAEARNLEREAEEIFHEAQRKRDSANVIRWFIDHREELLRTAASRLQGAENFGGNNNRGDAIAYRSAQESDAKRVRVDAA